MTLDPIGEDLKKLQGGIRSHMRLATWIVNGIHARVDRLEE
jgi:hypothetical protein